MDEVCDCFKGVYSKRKKIELWDILQSPEATRNQRLYLVGYLKKTVGYSKEEILSVIDKYNKWSDYKRSKTEKEVQWFFKDTETKVKCEDVVGTRQSSPPITQLPIHLLDPLNKEFFKDAVEVRYQLRNGEFTKACPDSLYDAAIYRSIEGTDHLLFVIDLDCPNDLEKCWRVTKRLREIAHWDWLKFSGMKGFHLIVKVCKNHTYEHLKKVAERIAQMVDLEGIKIDMNMFRQRQHIRGFCKHMESGLYSIPVTQNMTLQEILTEAKNWRWFLSSSTEKDNSFCFATKGGGKIAEFKDIKKDFVPVRNIAFEVTCTEGKDMDRTFKFVSIRKLKKNRTIDTDGKENENYVYDGQKMTFSTDIAEEVLEKLKEKVKTLME